MIHSDLLDQLDHFDPAIRQKAVSTLADLRAEGTWTPPAARPWMNLHCHTFHSFNANGWSPSRLVFEALQDGWEIFGSVDFDVLDAMPEVLEAGDQLGIRTVAGLESRVFIPAYKDHVINSPGEPGVAYFMLTGCTRWPDKGSTAAQVLASIKQIAQDRNRDMIQRVNSFLVKVQLDYEKEVLPRTPSGNPTERHLVEGYDRKARSVFGDDLKGLVSFWSEKFGMTESKVEELIHQLTPFQETLRSKLMKKGGPGYIEADPSRFPTLDAMIELGRATGALPTIAWLDGTSPGEADIQAMVEFMTEKGICALNIIPDRNWNIKDPDEKAIKLEKLKEVVETARKFDLPLVVGTEMNKAGQPFIDNYDASELQNFVEDFRNGARVLWGHTLLERALNFGWLSETARKCFGPSRKDRCEFYHQVGKKYAPGTREIERVKALEAAPKSILS
ncbi:MAG: hypothetical protein DYH02_06650 [Candidatus Omnitrophica bacterium COP1]|nr:hypothetical protein [Candidatus Omnitrophica bacterium COP1]